MNDLNNKLLPNKVPKFEYLVTKLSLIVTSLVISTH